MKRNVATTTKADGLPASQSVDESAADQNDAKVVHRSVKADSRGDNSSIAPPEARFIYPEFLPDPKFEWRNKLRERLEREDMLQRRSIVEIPEFYTGNTGTWITIMNYCI